MEIKSEIQNLANKIVRYVWERSSTTVPFSPGIGVKDAHTLRETEYMIRDFLKQNNIGEKDV